MKKIIAILMFVLTMSVHAQTNNGFKIASPQLDGWTLGHMGKGALTYTAARLLKCEPKGALLVAFTGAVMYELMDGMGIGIDPDPSGADFVGDVCADCLGAVIVCGLEILLRIDKRIDLYAYHKRIGLRIAL